MNDAIDEMPEIVCEEIEQRLRTAKPIAADVSALKRQLRSRHALPGLRLKPGISPEEVVEGFFRCVLAHYLHQRFDLHIDAIPACMNSSHKAVRRVCVAPGRHRHHDILDEAWEIAWDRMQVEHREVNVRVPARSRPAHADLYVVASNKVISIQFKYVGASGLRGVAECAEQLRRHAAQHERAILVVYNGTADTSRRDAAGDWLDGHHTAGVHIVGVNGPAIAPVRAAPA
jgi:hypothetical protein